MIIFLLFLSFIFLKYINNILFDRKIYSSNNKLNDKNNIKQNDYKKKSKISLYINL